MLIVPEPGVQHKILEEFDHETGAHVADLYDIASTVCPGVAETTILITDADEGAESDTYTLHYPDYDIISITSDVEFYRQFTNGLLSQRFIRLVKALNKPDLGKNIADWIDVSFAHELGHVAAAARVRTAYGENGINELNANLSKQYFNLPLAMPTTEAQRSWHNNTGGYRTYLESYGYTPEVFKAMLEQNLKNYTELPTEISADNFAISAMRRLYDGTTTDQGSDFLFCMQI